MVWLAIKDDCKTAEEVMRRVMDGHKRRQAAMAKLEEKVAPPPEAPKPKPPFVYTPPHMVIGSKPGKLHEILVQTSKHFDVSVGDLLSDSRIHEISRPRQVAYYLSRMLTNCSLHEIAKHYGKDHTGVIKGIRHIEAIVHFQTNKNIVYAVSKISENLRSSPFGFRALPGGTELSARLDNRNKYFPEDIERIKHLYMGGATEREIAMIMARSRQAIKSKLSRMAKAGVFAL